MYNLIDGRLGYLLFTLIGFLSGSILYCKILPRIFMNKDVCECSDDKNPGTFNVFASCGVIMGSVCLILELCKGLLPVYVSLNYLNPQNPLFSAVICAPVIGHALAPFDHFKGGKGIAVTFGVLLAILPVSNIVFLLAAIYIITSTLVKINPHRKRSILAFAVFAGLATPILLRQNLASIAIAAAVISLTVIYKHTSKFCTPEVLREEEEERLNSKKRSKRV